MHCSRPCLAQGIPKSNCALLLAYELEEAEEDEEEDGWLIEYSDPLGTECVCDR